MPQSEDNKNYHTGHRNRLRERFLNNSIDALAEHEVLELILFYSIPRVDTKPIAHRLIDIYGSLESVLKAPYESLVENGLTPSCAVHLNLFSQVWGWVSRNGIVGKKMTGYDDIGLFFSEELKNDSTERMVVLLLDTRDCVLEFKTLCTGSFNHNKVNMRNLTESCIMRKAAKVILAHNHPSGNINPSMEDYSATTSIENILNQLGVSLVEHYIISDGKYMGMKKIAKDMSKAVGGVYMSNMGFHDELD